VVRERTTTSCAISASLLLTLLFGMPPPSDARADQVPVFPSDPLWTIDVKEQPVAAPAAAGDLLFVALQSHVSALTMKDHAEVWTAKVVATGPLVATAERLLVPTDGAIQALDAASGAVAWTLKTAALKAPITVHDDLIFVASGEQLAAYNLADGALVWNREDLGTVEQRSAGHENWLYVPVADGRLVALDRGKGLPIWQTDLGIKPTEPLIAGTRVFAGSEGKKFCSFNLVSGREEWCQLIGAAVVGRPAVDDSRAYCVALDNQLYAFDRRNGSRLWRVDLRYRPSVGPVVIGTTIVAPGKTQKLSALDTKTGKEVVALTLPYQLAVPPAVIPASEAGPARIATLSGNLNSQWKLTLAGPPPATLPSQPIVPLTALPGLVVPRGAVPVPRE
jgi:outer membrane protein assembly factor BamB